LEGDRWGGVSLMQMDQGLDTGPVITRAQVLVRDDDTTASLSERLSLISAQLLADILPRWALGDSGVVKQDNASATYFKPLTKNAGQIDWALAAADIWRQVRAFQPWPGSFTRVGGKTLKIVEGCVSSYAPQGSIGTVVAIGKGLGVVTGSGTYELGRIQLEGKRSISAPDFARGQRDFVGTVLPN
jgi:methionyl-tRNA formyltransferase